MNTFLGTDGRYSRAQVVKKAEGLHLTTALDCEMDTSIRDMARRLLPLRWGLTLKATTPPKRMLGMLANTLQTSLQSARLWVLSVVMDIIRQAQAALCIS